MSKIIKAGGCSFLPLNGTDQRGENNPDEIKEFNSLSALVDIPPDAGDSRVGGDDIADESDSGMDHLALIRKEAEAILSKARAEAESLKAEARETLAEARQKSAEIESEAYAQGFEQGKKDGEELGRRQYQATAQRLNGIIEKIQTQGSALFNEYEAQLVQLTLEVARKIVHHEIKTDPQTVVRCVRAAMEKVVEGSHLCIHLNPRDAELVGKEIEVDLNAPGRHPVEIKPDTKVEQGGCLIETEFGFVDATLGSKWQAVTQTLGQILSERTGRGLKNDV